MKALQEIQSLSNQQKEALEDALLEIIDANNLTDLRAFLKEYPLQESFYTPLFKSEENGAILLPLFEPLWVILRAVFVCEENALDFCVLDFLFDEYGLSLVDMKNNFSYYEREYIKQKGDCLFATKELPSDASLLYMYLSESENPDPKIAQYLIKRGGTFKVYNVDGLTPLHFFAMCNEAQRLENAIKCGADVNCKAEYKASDANEDYLTTFKDKTPLHFAVSSDIKPLGKSTEVLLKLGANVNMVDYHLNTPLDCALGKKNTELLLKANGKTKEDLQRELNIDYSKIKEDLRKRLQREPSFNELREKYVQAYNVGKE